MPDLAPRCSRSACGPGSCAGARDGRYPTERPGTPRRVAICGGVGREVTCILEERVANADMVALTFHGDGTAAMRGVASATDTMLGATAMFVVRY